MVDVLRSGPVVAMSQRFEMRLSDELAEQIDAARGDVPRATWIKRTLESALEGHAAVAAGGPRGRPVQPAELELPASSRAPGLAETWARPR